METSQAMVKETTEKGRCYISIDSGIFHEQQRERFKSGADNQGRQRIFRKYRRKNQQAAAQDSRENIGNDNLG